MGDTLSCFFGSVLDALEGREDYQVCNMWFVLNISRLFFVPYIQVQHLLRDNYGGMVRCACPVSRNSFPRRKRNKFVKLPTKLEGWSTMYASSGIPCNSASTICGNNSAPDKDFSIHPPSASCMVSTTEMNSVCCRSAETNQLDQ